MLHASFASGDDRRDVTARTLREDAAKRDESAVLRGEALQSLTRGAERVEQQHCNC